MHIKASCVELHDGFLLGDLCLHSLIHMFKHMATFKFEQQQVCSLLCAPLDPMLDMHN